MAILGASFIRTVVVGPGDEFGAQPSSQADNQSQSRSQLAQVAPSSDFCSGYGDDRDYLYRLNTEIFNKPDGTKSFRLTRASDHKVLRQSYTDEKFFTDRSNGALQISYDVQEKCGGVDVVYTVQNPSGQSAMPPNLEIDGITEKTTGDFYLLDSRDAGNIRNVSQGGAPTNVFLGSNGLENHGGTGTLTYPNYYYSPVIVTHDNDFSAGSALLYPYLQYKHEVVPQLTKVTSGAQSGTWKHEYREFQKYFYSEGTDPTLLRPGEQRTYTVTLRFTQPRSWILTLESYKKYFKQTYGNVDQVRAQDFSPIFNDSLAFSDRFNRETDPRSYNQYPPYDGLSADGWGGYVSDLISRVQTRGFTRTMIWAPSGIYSNDIHCHVPEQPNYNGQGCNYPPAFMDFLPHLASTASELARFNQNNIQLGFWWGRSSQIPVPDQWDPEYLVDADYSNPSHLQYLDNQLRLAYERGAKIIGLDAFGGATLDRLFRINRMKQQTNNQILFIQEGSGPDIIHRVIANLYQPTTYNWWSQYNKTTTVGPDVLSRYINSGSEIWFHFFADHPSCQLVQKLISWGFTPIVPGTCSEAIVDARTFGMERVECFDGRDNNHDGKTDWPYDPGCSDAKDSSERTPPPPPAPPRPRATTTPPAPTLPGTDPTIAALLARIQELQAILTQLQAQANLLPPIQPVTQTTPTPRPVAPTAPKFAGYTRDLTIGSSGSDVTALQQFLVSRGFLSMPAGSSYGYFGALTRDAVARLQSYAGITPVDGYFGSATRARVNQF